LTKKEEEEETIILKFYICTYSVYDVYYNIQTIRRKNKKLLCSGQRLGEIVQGQ